MKRTVTRQESAPRSPLVRGLSLLEVISRGRGATARWRRAGLDLADAFPEPPDPPPVPVEPLPSSPLEQAWLLAETFGARQDDQRGHHGTPRAVACTLARLALPRHSTRVIDPACGGGSLLLGAVAHLLARDDRVDFDALAGWDIDPVAAALCQAVIWVAAGQPDSPVGRFTTRDFVTQGLGREPDSTVVLANPPWGTRVAPEVVERWRDRTGGELGDLLAGELNIYTLFLLEVLFVSPVAAGFITPIHWLHRRSLARMRHTIARTGRLRDVVVLRKRVFSRAPDMIPALTAWSAAPSKTPIRLRRTGFDAPIPLPDPLPEESRVDVDLSAWLELPFAALPLLRSDWFGSIGRRLMTGWPRLADPELPRAERWLHIGDGAYKTRVRDHLCQFDGGMPILIQAAEAGRYRLDPPQHRLTPTGEARLTPGERARFGQPKLVLHALKKASSPWRLSAAIDRCDNGPLALTNNFMLAVAERYEGDLHYPLVLLDSRLFNCLYTEHFPGVNIEAFSVGVLPFPWPILDDGGAPPEPDAGDPSRWHEWACRARQRAGCATEVPRAVYDWLVEQGRRLTLHTADFHEIDLQVEAVVAGLMGLTPDELETLLDRTVSTRTPPASRS